VNAAAIEPLGDSALLIRLGARIDIDVNRHALAVAAALRDADLPGVIDMAPAYASVCVRYAPLAWLEGTPSPFENIARRLRAFVDDVSVANVIDALPAIEIPVCYGGEHGPDLDAVAQHAQLSREEFSARHAGADYHVAMLGFAPGFPYLLGLDATLHVPRRANPRTRVPAGSVAIGGAQTGIYPRELPGGWQLIGRTPLTLFDVGRSPPALLAPGRRVRLRAIAADEFAAAR